MISKASSMSASRFSSANCRGDRLTAIDTKPGSPWLGGQSAVYIKAQL
jgi:hypothetical protein